MNSLRSQAFTGFRWTASMRVASQVITWGITLVVIRLLSPSDYGLVAMATVFISILALFSELGLGLALVQKPDLDERALRQTFGIVLLLDFSLAALLALSAPLIGTFYAEPRVVPVIQVLALRFAIEPFNVVPNALLQRQMEFRNRSLIDFSSTIIASITTLVMALASAGVWALVVGSLVDQICRTVLINRLAPFLRLPEFSLAGMRPLLSFGGQMTAAGTVGMLFSHADIIICAKVLGNEMVGFYSVAAYLASQPASRVNGLINQVAFPAFSILQRDTVKVGENVLLAIRILSFLAFPLLWGLSSVAFEFAEVILGPQWTLSAIPIIILALIVPLRIVANIVYTAVQALGRADIILRCVVWVAVVGTALLVGGAYTGGLTGLSVAWLFITPFMFVLVSHRSAPVISLRARQMFTSTIPAVTASLVMYLCVITARLLIDGLPSGVMRLTILIAVGAVAYFGISFGFYRRQTLEVVTMVRSILVLKRT